MPAAPGAWGPILRTTLAPPSKCVIRPGEAASLTSSGSTVGTSRTRIVFRDNLRVTIQQIGFMSFREGQEAEFEAYNRTNPSAGRGWAMHPSPGMLASGIAERVDDYSAAAFVYCATPQAVPRLDVASAIRDIERKPYEPPNPMERMFTA